MDPEKTDVLMRIGIALLNMQTAEQVLRFCMTFVFQKENGLSFEKLERQTEVERKKTMGYFLRELRKRVDSDTSFDSYLEQFLEDRNVLAHGLRDIPGWSLETEEGRSVARTFTNRCILESYEVMKVFTALVKSWSQQLDWNVPYPPNSQEFFEEIENSYLPFVDELFYRKTPE